MSRILYAGRTDLVPVYVSEKRFEDLIVDTAKGSPEFDVEVLFSNVQGLFEDALKVGGYVLPISLEQVPRSIVRGICIVVRHDLYSRRGQEQKLYETDYNEIVRYSKQQPGFLQRIAERIELLALPSIEDQEAGLDLVTKSARVANRTAEDNPLSLANIDAAGFPMFGRTLGGK